MNAKRLLRELRSKTGIKYSMRPSHSDNGWSAQLHIVTASKDNYSYSTGDKKFIRKMGAELYVAKNAYVDMCRLHGIRPTHEDSTAASKMNEYTIDFTRPISSSPPEIIPTSVVVPYWYSAQNCINDVPIPIVQSFCDYSSVQQQETSYRRVVLADLENVPLHYSTDFRDDTLYVGFLTVQHNTANKYPQWDAYSDYSFSPPTNNKNVYYTKGRYKEMVDHFMTFVSRSVVDYVLSDLQHCTVIYILSKDNSALCTKECIKSVIKPSGRQIKVKLIESLQQVE